ncbi:MAG: cell wall hydrolase [Rhodospirillales bacterium]|nr:cell wall hydrolase [Rhodospirillales bacterium]
MASRRGGRPPGGLYGAPDPTRGALWYHADYADPPWTRSMTRTTQIGRHIYYVQG